MKRRTFIKKTTAASVSLPFFLYGNKLTAISQHALFNAMNSDSDRVLVLIQLNGGNDGLNMVLPLDQYSNLFKARENVLIPEAQALGLTPETGLHPVMTGLKQTFDDGKLCVIQNVGYPDQNRSHFRSTDIWQSASSAQEVESTGWLGRFFDGTVANYPDNFPNPEFPDPFALTIGSIISETCQGFAANYSLAIQDPFGLSPLLEDDDVVTDPTQCYGKELDFVRTSIIQTNAYAGVISEAANKGTNLVDYPETNRLAQQLKTIALLISGGLKTKIYIANLGGFDTHANQVDIADNAQGAHANLLGFLSEAIQLFQTDLQMQQLEERVVGMTFSEFGRRIQSNGANGTDHGSAAPLFIFGKCVNPSILGANPVINDEVDPQEGVAMQYDFRSVYGSLLHQWFSVPVEDVQTLLYDGFSEMPIIEGCEPISSTDPILTTKALAIKAFPNPFAESTVLEIESRGEFTRLSIFNAGGYEVRTLVNQYLGHGIHRFTFYPENLTAGNYFAHMRTPSRQETINLIFLK
jgi:uncharacterized protein (DUF1501 family)